MWLVLRTYSKLMDAFDISFHAFPLFSPSPPLPSSLPPLSCRWSEVTQRLELWVEIMELNDQGEYVPVELQTKVDVLTGGIFMIRQVWTEQSK